MLRSFFISFVKKLPLFPYNDINVCPQVQFGYFQTRWTKGREGLTAFQKRWGIFRTNTVGGICRRTPARAHLPACPHPARYFPVTPEFFPTDVNGKTSVGFCWEKNEASATPITVVNDKSKNAVLLRGWKLFLWISRISRDGDGRYFCRSYLSPYLGKIATVGELIGIESICSTKCSGRRECLCSSSSERC